MSILNDILEAHLIETRSKIDRLLKSNDFDVDTKSIYRVDHNGRLVSVTSVPNVGIAWDLLRDLPGRNTEKLWIVVKDLQYDMMLTDPALIEHCRIVQGYKCLDAKIAEFQNAKSLYQIEQALSNTVKAQNV